jgi:hypothetical protein
MKLKCLVGLHVWQGCECSSCGRRRGEAHDWAGCRCRRCGATRDEWHDWQADLRRCRECDATPKFAVLSVQDRLEIRAAVDKLAARAHCRFGPGYNRNYGSYSGVDELALSDKPIDITKILSESEIRVAGRIGLDNATLARAAEAFCFHSINHQVGQDTWRDDTTTIVGDDAVSKLCKINGQAASYILYKVATAQPITVTLSGCLNSYQYTFDFAGRAKLARTELKRRGFGERDPLPLL